MDPVNQAPGLPVPPSAAAPVPQKKSSSAVAGWIVGAIALVLVFLMIMFVCGTCFFVSLVFRGAGFNGRGVGLIEITGVLSSDSSGLTGGTTSASLVQQLEDARTNSRIKAVLLRIDSPGGTPAAAQEVYQEVRRTIREKPVVVSVGDVCASGAYYIASASSQIFSEPDSDVGSIGVILEIPNVEELDQKIGLHWFVFTQGQYKDIGSPLRPPTPAEQAILTEQMRVAYDHFIRDVAAGRHMEEAKVRDLATGLTFPGTQAKELGLIDSIGNYRDAVTRAGRMGGIKGEVRLIPLRARGLFSVFSEFMTSFKDIANSLKTLIKRNGLNNDNSPPQMK